MKSLFIPLLFQLLFTTANLQCADETKPIEGEGGETGHTHQTSQAKGLKVTKATRIARMTGRPVAGESLYSPNNTADDYNIGGTDLGIYWRLDEDKVGILFGDTYGREWKPGYTPDWRSNALAFSSDTNLEDGLSIDNMVCDDNGNASQIIFSAHNTAGNGDWSSIPTAAIRINGTDYVHYMNVKAWNPVWLTNWSGYAVSDDDGKTWELHKEVYASDSKFAQQALWEKMATCIASVPSSGAGDCPTWPNSVLKTFWIHQNTNTGTNGPVG